MSADQIGLWAGFILTLMVFSYVLGDNFFYRLAVYVFAGLVAAFTLRVVVETVLTPWVRGTLMSDDLVTRGVGIIPLALGILLLFKSSPRFSALGTPTLGLIIGVGAAVAVVGAVSGTLMPLTGSAINALGIDPINGFLVVLGIICTLAYFQYSSRRLPNGMIRRHLLVRAMSAVGQGVIVITLGTLYGGAILTGLVVFSDRVAYLVARIGGG